MFYVISSIMPCTLATLSYVIAIYIAYRMLHVLYRKVTLRYTTTAQGTAKVISKECYNGYNMQGAEAEYPTGMYDECRVYVLFKGKKICFEDEEIYGRVKVGELVKILIHKGYNRRGELKHTYLSVKK